MTVEGEIASRVTRAPGRAVPGDTDTTQRARRTAARRKPAQYTIPTMSGTPLLSLGRVGSGWLQTSRDAPCAPHTSHGSRWLWGSCQLIKSCACPLVRGVCP